jgi:hypothetical protein
MRRSDVARVVMVVCLAVVAGVASTALGQYNFTFSAGYSHIELDNPSNLFHSKDGPYFDTDFAFHPPHLSLPLTIGVGITGSGYFDSQDTTFRFSPTTFGTATLYSDIGFFEIEPRVALSFYSGGRRLTGFFVRPRIGAGLLVDSYGIDHVSQTVFQTTFATFYHTGAAFEIRPAVQVGFSWGPGEAGAEVSYMAAWGDFGEFGSEAQEFRAGGFFTWRF